MSKKKVLTVCLANAARSPTAEWLLQGQGYKVKSCGVAEVATKPCDTQDLKWADRVVVMETYMKENLEKRFPEAKGKITVLEVPEVGKWACSPSLIDEISEALKQNRFRVRKTKEMTKASQDCQNFAWNMSIRKQRASRDYKLIDYWDVTPEFTEEEIAEARAYHPEAFSTPRKGGETVGRDETGDYLYQWSPPSAERASKKHRTDTIQALEEYTDKVKEFFED